jgi:TonB family protein
VVDLNLALRQGLIRHSTRLASFLTLAANVAWSASGLALQPAPPATPPATSAPAPAAAPATTSAPESPPAGDRAGTYRAFREQFDARHFDAALPPAQQLVEQTEQEFGRDSVQLMNPLINLATTQLRLKDYAGAETSYKRAVKLVEAHQGGYSHEIIKPLLGLGMTYSASGDYVASADALKRAVDVSRKIDGLFNPAQLELLDPLIASYTALNSYEDAQREQQYALRLAEATYGKDDPRIVPALERTAGWLESQGRFTTARQIHARALDIERKSGGLNNLGMTGPLRGIARTYRLEFLVGPERPEGSSTEDTGPPIGGVPGPIGIPSNATGVSAASAPNSDGETALVTALKIFDANPGKALGERAQTMIELGDWRLTSGDWRQAMNAYREAWKALKEPGAAGTAALESPFPVIYRAPAAARPPQDTDKYTQHYAEIEFTVTAEGRVKDAKLGTSDVSEATGKLVLSAVKRARYRPRFVNGEPVASTGVRYRETIYVRG